MMKFLKICLLFCVLVDATPTPEGKKVRVSFRDASPDASEKAKFFTADPSLFFRWVATLNPDDRKSVDPEENSHGHVFLEVERILFGKKGSAWLMASQVPTEDEDEQEALFRAVFLLEILNSLDLLGEGSELSEVAKANLLTIARDCSMDQPEKLADLVSRYLIVFS
jgi:hypothetical protein